MSFFQHYKGMVSNVLVFVVVFGTPPLQFWGQVHPENGLVNLTEAHQLSILPALSQSILLYLTSIQVVAFRENRSRSSLSRRARPWAGLVKFDRPSAALASVV